MLLTTGTIVAGYRIDGILGRGGMGVVYEATQLSFNRKVALKLIAPERGGDAALQERFRREGLRQAAIDHPHIVAVHEAGETELGLYFAMRMVRGPTLKELIRACDLDVDRILRILSQIADALDTAHAAGLIHRDVKPQNILVGIGDHAYLADFGLTQAPGDRSLTQPGGFVGTLHYVAPEQIRGERTTPCTDVYALAAVLYECLTGVVPYEKDSEAALLWAHLALATPRVSQKRPDLPASLDAVIGRAMAKQPEARFATAGEMLRSAQASFDRGRRVAMSVPGPQIRPRAANTPAADANASTVDAGLPVFEDARSGPEPSPAPADALGQSKPLSAGGSAQRPSRAPRAAIAIAIAVLLLAGAVGGYVRGASGGEGERATRTLAAGRLRIEVPAGWQRTAPVFEVPGLALSRSAGASSTGRFGRDEGLLVGLTDGSGATLLPATFIDRLPRRPQTDDVVTLGKLTGYRYRELRPRGLDRPLTLFTVPTQKQVATVVCVGSRVAGSTAECERAAATLELDGIGALTLGAREEYAKALGSVIESLNKRLDLGRTVRRRAAAPSARAVAAQGLAHAYDEAASRLASAPAGPTERPVHTALRDDARRAGAAYARLASAARRDSAAGFNAAASSVRRHEFAIERDLRALERLGYSVK